MGSNTKCFLHDNEHPDHLCPRQHVLKIGPTRVVIDEFGTTVDSDRARTEFGIVPVVIFLRNDDWSLGAPKHLEAVAKKMWKKDWIAVARHPFKDFDPLPK